MPVVAVEKATFLLAVDGVVRYVKVQNETFRNLRKAIEETRDEEAFNGLGIRSNSVVPIFSRFGPHGEVQAIQGALARQGGPLMPGVLPFLAHDVLLSNGHGEQRVHAKLIVIVQILVSKGQTKDPLANQLLDAVLDSPGLTSVNETVSKSAQNMKFLVDLLQSDDTSIGGEVSAVKIGGQNPASGALQLDPIGLTVCIQGLPFVVRLSDSWYSTYSTMAALFCILVVHPG